jgi:hypothetical protein
MNRCLRALCLLSLTAGCAAIAKEQVYTPMPEAAVRFPADSWQDIVYTAAGFNQDHRREFGVDLVKKRGVVPVHLSIELRGENMDSARVQLNSDRMNLRLFLPDGTSLLPVSGDEVAATLHAGESARVRAKRFRGDEGLLSSDPTRGYVFFKLAPEEEFVIEGKDIFHIKHGVAKPLDLTRSLVAFNVIIENEPYPIYVGLKN